VGAKGLRSKKALDNNGHNAPHHLDAKPKLVQHA